VGELRKAVASMDESGYAFAEAFSKEDIDHYLRIKERFPVVSQIMPYPLHEGMTAQQRGNWEKIRQIIRDAQRFAQARQMAVDVMQSGFEDLRVYMIDETLRQTAGNLDAQGRSVAWGEHDPIHRYSQLGFEMKNIRDSLLALIMGSGSRLSSYATPDPLLNDAAKGAGLTVDGLRAVLEPITNTRPKNKYVNRLVPAEFPDHASSPVYTVRDEESIEFEWNHKGDLIIKLKPVMRDHPALQSVTYYAAWIECGFLGERFGGNAREAASRDPQRFLEELLGLFEAEGQGLTIDKDGVDSAGARTAESEEDEVNERPDPIRLHDYVLRMNIAAEEIRLFVAEIRKALGMLGIPDRAKMMLGGMELRFSHENGGLIVRGIEEGVGIRIDAQEVVLNERGKPGEAVILLSDLMLLYRVAEGRGAEILGRIQAQDEMKIMMFHVDHLIAGDESLKEGRMRRIIERLEGSRNESTAIVLEGSASEKDEWIEAAPRLFSGNVPRGFEKAPVVHVAGISDPVLLQARKKTGHKWIAVDNEPVNGAEALAAYAQAFDLAAVVPALDEEALRDPANVAAGLAYGFFKSICRDTSVTREQFADILTDPRKAREFPVDPLSRVDLDTAIRFYELVMRMADQAA